MEMTKKEILKWACKRERKISEIMVRFNKLDGFWLDVFYGKTLDDVFSEVECSYKNFPQKEWDDIKEYWKFEDDSITLDKLDEETIQQRLDNDEVLECIATLEQKLEFLECIEEFRDITLYDEEHNSFELFYCDVDFENNTFKMSNGLTENRLSEIEDELLKPIEAFTVVITDKGCKSQTTFTDWNYSSRYKNLVKEVFRELCDERYIDTDTDFFDEYWTFENTDITLADDEEIVQKHIDNGEAIELNITNNAMIEAIENIGAGYEYDVELFLDDVNVDDCYVDWNEEVYIEK
ncbi:hypothetical protein SAMN05421767_1586 [Granulicatella balaenopterae]|uniref:Uncharacterized protein n=1 Tax=Granulicatella balaenopterae TaxID=137733 RepID=A0A1H9PGL7_9LACT|nr:hypothetical protein [Granulicatella balaenopterae]SER47297.1 hypothetical protein SAMN05421767_1586 [Granulicatella balaenopterae]